jgi:iron complex transport system substrate-binding protein
MMRKWMKSLVVFSSLVMISAGLVGCGAPQTAANHDSASGNKTQTVAPAEKVMKDGMGHDVTIPANPQHVWAPYLEDPLIALGITPVGQWSRGNVVSDYLQPWLKGVPKIDFTGGGLNPENVMSLNPDLMILFSASLAQNGKYEQYSKVAPTYVFNDVQDPRQTILTLGKIFNKTSTAEKVIREYDLKVKEAKAKLQQSVGNKTVALLEVTNEGIILIGKQYFSGQVLYGDLGLTPPKLATGWDTISMEKLPDLNADVIFLIVPEDGKARSQELLSSSVWKGLPAVKQGQVFQVSYGNWINNGFIANGLTVDEVVKALTK